MHYSLIIWLSLLLVTGLHQSTDFPINNNIDLIDAFEDQVETVSLTDLFSDQGKFGDKTIRVKGKVVKVNANILGKNWIHIQDGTEDKKGDPHDLTITSDETFEVDEEVIIEGKIVLDRDFGAGYFYEVIMEEGKRYKKKI